MPTEGVLLLSEHYGYVVIALGSNIVVEMHSLCVLLNVCNSIYVQVMTVRKTTMDVCMSHVPSDKIVLT